MVKILIVDDSIFVCNMIEKLLADENSDVRIENSAAAGFDSLKEYTPDVILLDMVLPDMNGYEVCMRLKSMSQLKNVPVIFLTSNGDEDSIVRGFEAGATDYIKKPFSSLELKARVMCHAQNKLMADQLHQANRKLERLMEEIRLQGYRDALTDIYNRKYFLEGMERWKIQMKVKEESACLLLIDVDYFKQINDTYGHVTGDYVLSTVAKLIKCSVSSSSVVGRWGGDEFLVLLFDTTPRQAMTYGEAIQKNIKEFPFSHDGHQLSCTVTVGETRLYPEMEIDENLKLADQALYVGKKRGRNCCVEEGSLV